MLVGSSETASFGGRDGEEITLPDPSIASREPPWREGRFQLDAAGDDSPTKTLLSTTTASPGFSRPGRQLSMASFCEGESSSHDEFVSPGWKPCPQTVPSQHSNARLAWLQQKVAAVHSELAEHMVEVPQATLIANGGDSGGGAERHAASAAWPHSQRHAAEGLPLEARLRSELAAAEAAVAEGERRTQALQAEVRLLRSEVVAQQELRTWPSTPRRANDWAEPRTAPFASELAARSRQAEEEREILRLRRTNAWLERIVRKLMPRAAHTYMEGMPPWEEYGAATPPESSASASVAAAAQLGNEGRRMSCQEFVPSARPVVAETQRSIGESREKSNQVRSHSSGAASRIQSGVSIQTLTGPTPPQQTAPIAATSFSAAPTARPAVILAGTSRPISEAAAVQGRSVHRTAPLPTPQRVVDLCPSSSSCSIASPRHPIRFSSQPALPQPPAVCVTPCASAARGSMTPPSRTVLRGNGGGHSALLNEGGNRGGSCQMPLSHERQPHQGGSLRVLPPPVADGGSVPMPMVRSATPPPVIRSSTSSFGARATVLSSSRRSGVATPPPPQRRCSCGQQHAAQQTVPLAPPLRHSQTPQASPRASIAVATLPSEGSANGHITVVRGRISAAEEAGGIVGDFDPRGALGSESPLSRISPPAPQPPGQLHDLRKSDVIVSDGSSSGIVNRRTVFGALPDPPRPPEQMVERIVSTPSFLARD